MRKVAVVAHSGKSFGGGLRELREVLARQGVSDPLWYEVKKSRHAPEYARRAIARGTDVMFIWGGDGMVQRCIDGAATVVLVLRKRWRLAIYLLVAGAGALVLDPVLESLVGRLRPVVAHPIAHGNGNSFPSGHSLGSIVCYGAILLVFLPAARGRWRRAFIAGVIALVAWLRRS
jgi:membrane-associated phospholipid phosphatase